MRVLLLAGRDSTSAQYLRAWAERLCSEMNLQPIYLQSSDPPAIEAIASLAGYRILPLDDAAVAAAVRLSASMARPLMDGDPECLQDKWGQRLALSHAGLPSPPFALVESAGDVCDFARHHGYPLMLKPSRGTESRGVSRVDAEAQIERALSLARIAARATGLDRVMAEGYLDGPDVAVESMVIDGVTTDLAVSQSGWHGHIWRAAAPLGPGLQPQLGAIAAAIAEANRALGLRWAATSNEVRVTAEGPVIVEVNARLGGGSCEDAVRLHSGLDRIGLMLRLLAGDEVQMPAPLEQPVAQATMLAGASGRVLRIDVPDDLFADPDHILQLYLAPGRHIDTGSRQSLGWLVLRGREGEHADQLLPRATGYARGIRIVTTE
jgi:biotin carboxylase